MSNLFKPISLLALLGTMLVAPGLAHATLSTGRVVKIMSCADGSNPRKLLIKLSTGNWFYMGTESATQTSTVGSIAMAALLSGKPVTIDSTSNVATYCNGIKAFFLNNPFIEIGQ